MLKVWIAQRPPGFGFVLMSSGGDAEDAVRGLHGTKMWGRRYKGDTLKFVTQIGDSLCSTFRLNFDNNN